MNQLPIDLDTLKEHIEHELVFTTFGTDGDVWNYTLACEDCQAVIADIDVPLDDEDGILQRVDERIDENGKDD